MFKITDDSPTSKKLIIEGVEKEEVEAVEAIINEFTDKYNKVWQSIYNHYVNYDYEPFGSDGFNNTYTLKFLTLEQKSFAKYLLEKRRKLTDFLNRCLSTEPESEGCKEKFMNLCKKLKTA